MNVDKFPFIGNDKRRLHYWHYLTIYFSSFFFFRYVCLLCSKLYTSRYNIRMHLNSHTGRNVHTCPYCSIQFTSRQTYEGHLKSHTSNDSIAKDDDENASIVAHHEAPNNNAGPQIVSVKSIGHFEKALKTEEIQIGNKSTFVFSLLRKMILIACNRGARYVTDFDGWFSKA